MCGFPQVPNVYVNLVAIIDVNAINEIKSLECNFFHECV